MLSRTVSVVAAVCGLAQPADQLDEDVEHQHVEEHLRPGRTAVLHQPAEQVSLEPPAAQGVEFARDTCGRRGAPSATRADVHDPATVAQPAPAIPSSGKAGPAEDQDQSQGDVHRRPRGLDAEHRPGLPAAGEEAVDRGHDQHRQGGEAEAAQVDHLEGLQGRRMPADRDQVRRDRDHEQEQEPGEHREVDPLPDGRPDPLRPAGPGVLGDERRHIAGRHLEQPERQPEPHDRRERRGHLPRVVPGEQDGVDEHLDRHEALADDQRQSEREQLPASSLARGTLGRARASRLGLTGGLFDGIFQNCTATHHPCLFARVWSDNNPRYDTWTADQVRRCGRGGPAIASKSTWIESKSVNEVTAIPRQH